MKFRRGTIVIFGGTAYLGSHIALQMSKRGYRIILAEEPQFFDQRNYMGLRYLCSDQIKLVQVDWTDSNAVRKLFHLEKGTSLVIYGGNQFYTGDFNASNLKSHQFHINAVLTIFSVLEEFVSLPFLLLSSYKVYGKSNKVSFKEDFKLNKGDNSKLELNSLTEQLFSIAERLNNAAIARVSSPLGVHDSMKIGPSQFIKHSLFHKRLFNAIYHGKTYDLRYKHQKDMKVFKSRDIIHVIDAAEAVALISESLIECLKMEPTVYNVSSNQSFPSNKLLKVMKFFSNTPFSITEQKIGASENLQMQLCNNKLNAELGWFAKYSLVEAIKSHVAYIDLLRNEISRAA